MIFLQYPKCTTCKKAKKWLDDHKITYEDRNIKEMNPSAEELKEWYSKSGLDIKKFFNTSGNLYKDMYLKDKLPDMQLEEKLTLLATDGMLVKRPIIVDGDLVLTGFKESEWEERILGKLSEQD
ncbi:MAG: Spx/MgsR family RNA polymerase-binding regulatory protein [Lachnospiraceae bacterium]|jgi:arsenate reductase|nr:Spx/MgsR family RNA polymerase-binding regulatory protein [Lachnospiraceae bacterium]